MPHNPNPNNRFIEQARADYMGTPKRIARCRDQYDEEHVVIEMHTRRGQVYHLDWIGAELAEHPDEFGPDAPFPNLDWAHVPDAKET
jgi:hypothetical protein